MSWEHTYSKRETLGENPKSWIIELIYFLFMPFIYSLRK